ncbi:hypothetical protein [Pseudomonas sp. NPDC087336]|uniref:hypothetical protein n=1 Tax=Pseudomonas sp. NPDC087336 TaxID=3364436 RepID=UPI0037FD1560
MPGIFVLVIVFQVYISIAALPQQWICTPEKTIIGSDDAFAGKPGSYRILTRRHEWPLPQQWICTPERQSSAAMTLSPASRAPTGFSPAVMSGRYRSNGYVHLKDNHRQR